MRYLFLLFVFALPVFASAQAHTGPVLESVDDMPLWPGTDDIQSSNQKMLEYIYQEVTYPEAAKKAKVEGMVIVSFVVYADGTVSQLELKRDPGTGLGVEGMRVATKMARDITGWTPGMENGVAVNTQYHLPIKFKLKDDSDEKG